jgi:cyclic pyranopterin phosphate synthase
MDQVVPRGEMLARLAEHYGEIDPVIEASSAPADRFRLLDGTVFGIISSTTEPFCRACDRSRITADGMWLTCLYARSGLDLRALLRGGAAPEEIAETVARGWTQRADRGAEERLAVASRAPLATTPELRRDPHLEMHTRGG